MSLESSKVLSWCYQRYELLYMRINLKLNCEQECSLKSEGYSKGYVLLIVIGIVAIVSSLAECLAKQVSLEYKRIHNLKQQVGHTQTTNINCRVYSYSMNRSVNKAVL